MLSIFINCNNRSSGLTPRACRNIGMNTDILSRFCLLLAKAAKLQKKM